MSSSYRPPGFDHPIDLDLSRNEGAPRISAVAFDPERVAALTARYPDTGSLRSADWNADDHIAHERGHIAVVDEVEVIIVALEELRAVREVGFPAEDAGSHPPERGTPREMLAAFCAATEAGADIRCKQPVGTRCRRCKRERQPHHGVHVARASQRTTITFSSFPIEFLPTIERH